MKWGKKFWRDIIVNLSQQLSLKIDVHPEDSREVVLDASL